MTKSILTKFSAAAASVVFLFCFSFAASAATLTVTSTGDTTVGAAGCGDGCSLREAVSTAVSGDTIAFSALFNAAQTISLPTGQITIDKNLTVNGPGANLLTVQNTAAASGSSRVFTVNSGIAVTLNGITVTGGNPTNGGGGIANNGNLTINNCVITGNTTTGFAGGGIGGNTPGSVTINNSTISNNTASGGGGGGGGIDTDGTMNITNSTISGNSQTNGGGGNGGGIGVFGGTTTITNSTITNNTGAGANSAGGVLRFAGTVTVRNTIIAANVTTPNVAGAFTSSGYNLIGSLGTATGFTGTADQTNVSNANVNLGALALNSGTTPTHALLSGSFAIDKGSNFGSAVDQRGLLRPYDNPAVMNASGGNGTDIGAFEVQLPTAAGALVSGRVLLTNGRGLTNATVTLTDSNGDTQTVRTSSFGYYHFEDVAAGQTYIIAVQSKRYQFVPQVVNVNEDLSELNFLASTGKY